MKLVALMTVTVLAALSRLEGKKPQLETYQRGKETQAIYQLRDRDTIEKVAVPPEWTVSGGMEGIDPSLWSSTKKRYIPEGEKVRYWLADIQVLNSSREYQPNLALRREYPAGTVFEDSLRNHLGVLFERRTREKLPSGKWRSLVAYSREEARPKGYEGLTVSCSECHDKAGSGKYNAGLVPGGDTVLSDPLDWSAASGYLR